MITRRRILEFLEEQQIQPDEVFLMDGGDFVVSDLTDKWLGTRIISISANSTIEPLNISPFWMAILLESYHVRFEFLQVLLAFGDEPQHTEACNGNDAFYETENQGSKRCYAQYWRPYLRWMGEDYDKINILAAVADTSDVGKESFEQLRRLRMLKDYTDLATGYCMSNLQVLSSLRLSMETSSSSTDSILSVENSVRSHVKSLELLKDRIDNTIHLISLTVDLHNQEQAATLNLKMKKLAEETSAVTKKLAVISEHSANETEVVRMITIVSAIYLPGSFVTSIFGMNFFQFDKQGGIAMSRGIWIFISAWSGLVVSSHLVTHWSYGKRRVIGFTTTTESREPFMIGRNAVQGHPRNLTTLKDAGLQRWSFERLQAQRPQIIVGAGKYISHKHA
ncbi:hypothetical protein M406DRAFT_326601 [Cryphonectria parasitica EP155]|uniref:Uncharacterized protein n=1 Tax=Cryphonectria parasitica (strain ATCC 38755 / EP155) TaxID=660469 RepID=A0A9P4YF65_CRYP1|nr:uncharacterized protein M406DRAFT_326601 [Cryphonectria parasitica EP155]KAF3771210.1 hypothetical protein M406DRAFT_326601 [Cryphonectria parasitica EP155]